MGARLTRMRLTRAHESQDHFAILKRVLQNLRYTYTYSSRVNDNPWIIHMQPATVNLDAYSQLPTRIQNMIRKATSSAHATAMLAANIMDFSIVSGMSPENTTTIRQILAFDYVIMYKHITTTRLRVTNFRCKTIPLIRGTSPTE